MTVTAIITTYGRDWETVHRAIGSVLKQTRPVDEILLIDDNIPGSTLRKQIQDNVLKIPEVHYIQTIENSGVGSARNLGIFNTSSDYIAFLDDDDEWLPDKIEKQLEVIEREPNTALVFGIGIKNFTTMSKKTYTWSKSIFKEHPSFEDMLANDHVGSASHPLIRTDILRQVGGFQLERSIAVEDYELWIRISKSHKLSGIDRPLYTKYMDDGEHVSQGKLSVYLGYIRIYDEFYDQYQQLPYAKSQILRNIVRTGIKGRHISVIPYCVKWVFANAVKRRKNCDTL